jgi:hypothetical protein
MLLLILIDIIIYILILIKVSKLQKKVLNGFNFLHIACVINICYDILFLSQVYYPVFEDNLYIAKEYLLLLQFLCMMLYFQRYLRPIKKPFYKLFIYWIFSYKIVIVFSMLTRMFPGVGFDQTFYIFSLLDKHLIWLTIILIVSYIYIMNKSTEKYNSNFILLVFLFFINNFLLQIQVMYDISAESLWITNIILSILFNTWLLKFITKDGGRYLND